MAVSRLIQWAIVPLPGIILYLVLGARNARFKAESEARIARYKAELEETIARFRLLFEAELEDIDIYYKQVPEHRQELLDDRWKLGFYRLGIPTSPPLTDEESRRCIQAMYLSKFARWRVLRNQSFRFRGIGGREGRVRWQDGPWWLDLVQPTRL